MQKRAVIPKNKRVVWVRRAFLCLIPVVLAAGTWKIHQLQEPVAVLYGTESIKAAILFARLDKEATLHPYARTITINWSQPWPKESGLQLSFSESVVWDQHQETLTYGASEYGWVYSHVERHGITLLAKANLPDHPITLPAALHWKLRGLGWTLTEHYLP